MQFKIYNNPISLNFYISIKFIFTYNNKKKI